MYLPKIGKIKAKFHRGEVIGKIKTVTVSYEANQYYASINYEDGIKETIGLNNGKFLGIDVGVKVFAYTSENQAIVVEDLKIKNMSKKAKGSIENPNMRASAKSGLNRSILQQSWGKFFELLEYKLKRNGGKLIKVNPQYTSQKCSKCGYIDQENRETQSRFICKACRVKLNADYNASVNILNAVGTTVKAF